MSRFDEFDDAVDFGEDCVVFADADIFTGVPFGASLAHDDVACFYLLAAELFDA